jgi:hypothetical protein
MTRPVSPPSELTARPVIVIHLEDPPGSGLAACCGLPFHSTSEWPKVPRVPCTGCLRRSDAARAAPQADEGPRERLREATRHVIQAYEWHRQGTRPTGQSRELSEAIRILNELQPAAAPVPAGCRLCGRRTCPGDCW